ncbi:DUF4123 domain-containing protein [Agarilytica rhodophyticola]|uniref:DUF4123 domain-containing protein n=1 Tax=Agarilytica rhodophyticola TaxID=1737490 RepID=UPI000B342B90|nr:DUF4123 domain-containing protein [Agarilytica rhodophyticola]
MTTNSDTGSKLEYSDGLQFYIFEELESLVKNGQLYTIIDAITHNDVAGFAAELIDEGLASTLPEIGASEFTSNDAIPYIVKISPRFWRFITREIWPPSKNAETPEESLPSWGIFFELADNSLAFSSLVKHWRRWYFVDLPNNQQPTPQQKAETPHTRAVFRFFDPRLISAFLDVATVSEKITFFGPTARIFLPQGDGSANIYQAPEITPETSNIRPLNISEKTPFIMRPEHMQALELRRLEQRIPVFREYLEKHFEVEFQRWNIEDRELFIQSGLRKASDYGFLSERSAAGWLSLQLLYGFDFASSQPWAMNILKDPRHTVGNEDHADRLINAGFDNYQRIQAQQVQEGAKS